MRAFLPMLFVACTASALGQTVIRMDGLGSGIRVFEQGTTSSIPNASVWVMQNSEEWTRYLRARIGLPVGPGYSRPDFDRYDAVAFQAALPPGRMARLEIRGTESMDGGKIRLLVARVFVKGTAVANGRPWLVVLVPKGGFGGWRIADFEADQ